MVRPGLTQLGTAWPGTVRHGTGTARHRLCLLRIYSKGITQHAAHLWPAHTIAALAYNAVLGFVRVAEAHEGWALNE